MRNSKAKRLRKLLNQMVDVKEVILEQLPVQKRVVFSKDGREETHLTKLRVLKDTCGRKAYLNAKARLKAKATQ